VQIAGQLDGGLTRSSFNQQWDAQQQIWMKGKVIDLDGNSKNCAWESSAGTCK
jgi:hypothetical protein